MTSNKVNLARKQFKKSADLFVLIRGALEVVEVNEQP